MKLGEIIAACIGAGILVAVIVYIAANQKNKVLEWLKFAVSEAEKKLGSGTGQFKLHLVYDWFCEKFPIVAALLPFKVFSAWVDVALKTMKDWLNSNEKINWYIKEAQK